ncbi:MAG: hypothetical protein ACI4ME_12480 [Aristaeellaceae bacterium]
MGVFLLYLQEMHPNVNVGKHGDQRYAEKALSPTFNIIHGFPAFDKFFCRSWADFCSFRGAGHRQAQG